MTKAKAKRITLKSALKSMAITFLYFVLSMLIGAIAVASALFISLGGTLLILFFFVFITAIATDKYDNEAFIGIGAGLSISVAITLIYLAPML
jgi:hypothetical protein